MLWFYPSDGKQTAKASFTRIIFGFTASNLVLINDSGSEGENTADLEFSFNGIITQGHVIPGEPLNLGDIALGEIWVKGNGSSKFRIWAYAK